MNMIPNLDSLWTSLLRQKPCYPGDRHYLAPGPDAVRRLVHGDIIDAARDCLISLRWHIDDGQLCRPLRRRAVDFLLTDVFAAMPRTPRVLQGITSLRSIYDNYATRFQWTYLSDICSPAGTALLTAQAVFRRGGTPPLWFSCLEDFFRLTPHSRLLPGAWTVAGHDGRPPDPASQGTRWQDTERAPSVVFDELCGTDDSPAGQLFRHQQAAYAAQHGIVYESVSDGTYRNGRASFAWQVTVDLRHQGAPLPRRHGWVTGLARSDAAELAGLISQLRAAPDCLGVRLASDCNGMLLLLIRARTMTRQQLMRHTHRTLLLEWLALEGRRLHGPV